jgi:peptidoglycan/xylan/chitin deacetylase (PgdA/CDA1 family)
MATHLWFSPNRIFVIIAKKIIGSIGGFVPLKVLFRFYWSDCIVLTYHSLSSLDTEPEINKNPYRTKSAFTDDIRFIKNNFNVLNMRQFLEINDKGGKFPERSLLITFDDGLAIQYNHMYPILRSYELPATFFLNNAFIDNQDLHYERKKYIILRKLNELHDNSLERKISKTVSKDYSDEFNLMDFIQKLEYNSKNMLDTIAGELGISFADYLHENKIYITNEQIEIMLKNNISIGGHSIDHPDFTRLSLAQQVDQTLSSVNDLVSRFQLDYKAFAFPYNDRALDTALFEKIHEGIDVSFGSSDFARDEFNMHFQRGSIDNSTQGFKQALAVLFGKYYIRKITGKHFIKRY